MSIPLPPRDNPINQPATYELPPEEILGKIYKNVRQDLIITTTDRAYIHISEWHQKLTHKLSHGYDWLGRLSLFAALMIVMLTADFKDRFHVPKDVWSEIFVVATVLAGIWLVLTVLRYNRVSVDTVKAVIGKLKEDSPLAESLATTKEG